MNQPKDTAGKDHFGKPVRLAATWDEACKAINAIHSYGSTVLHAFVCTLPKHDENTLHASFDLDGNQLAGWWDHGSSLALTAKAGFVSVGARPVGEPPHYPDLPQMRTRTAPRRVLRRPAWPGCGAALQRRLSLLR